MKGIVRFLGIIAIFIILIACAEPEPVLNTRLPALTGTVSINGTAQVGQILKVNINNLGGSGDVFYSWKRGTNVIGSDSIYIIQATDVNSSITLTVTRSENSGSITSAPVGPITNVFYIIGEPYVDQTLSVNVTGLDNSSPYIYQWMRGGSTVVGSDNSTYNVQADDVGSSITVTVITSSGNYTSAPTLPITYPNLPALSGTVNINGTVQIGEMLTADVSNLGGSGVITYQWRSGYNIVGTNNNTYIVQNDDIGFHITVIVIRSGNSGSVTSNSTNLISVDYGDFSIASNSFSSINYEDGVLTISGNGTYYIGMKNGIETTNNRIIVMPGVIADVNLIDIYIEVSRYSDSAFDMTGATVNLTLIGNNELYSSPKPALYVPTGSTLVITEASTGSLNAINYNHTGNPSIGAGLNDSGGNISINGGTINASGINGFGYIEGIIKSISGNAVVFASIKENFLVGATLGPCIIFAKEKNYGEKGTMYGNVTLKRDFAVPFESILDITNGQTLSIQSGYTLTNYGTIYLHDGGNINGIIEYNQPIIPSFLITGSSAYKYAHGELTITGNGTYTIKMREDVTSTNERIIVNSGVNANITLSDVVIESNSYDFYTDEAIVNLTLIGKNVTDCLYINKGTIVITGASTGSLTVTNNGNYNSGWLGGSGSNITINGGIITAIGIGYFNYYSRVSDCNIIINGGTINITGGSGIIGSYITINGGIINGTWICSLSNLTINNGIINLTRGVDTLSSSIININGGTITGDVIGRNDVGTIAAIGGNAVIIASSIQPALPTGANLGPAIVFNGNNGTMYGNVTLQQNVIFETGRILNISNGQNLTIPSGRTLTNNGTINNSGTIHRYGVINGSGSVTGNQPVQ